MFTSRDYAIGRAHYQIAGGNRTLLLLGVVYIAVASAILGIIFYNVKFPVPRRVMDSVFAFVMVVEAFVLILFGSIRVGGTIRFDVTSNMIESHRLMPISSWRAVLGYLFGSTPHVLLVTLLNVLLLAGIRTQTGLAFDDFVINQLVLVMFALMVWTFAAMGALMIKQMMPLLVLGFMFGTIGSAILRQFGILPGLSLLGSPFLGETIFAITTGRYNIRSAYPWALTAQLAFAALFFLGACRRYRGTFPSTFNIPQAMGLGLIWGILSLAAIVNWTEFGRVRGNAGMPSMSQQIVASLAVAAIFAIIPMHALVMQQTRRDLPRWLVLATLAGTLFIGISCAAAAAWDSNPPINLTAITIVTLLVMSAHVMAMYQSFRATRRMSGMATAGLLCSLLFFVWVMPFFLELIRWILLGPEARDDADFSVLGTLSPLGLLISRWTMPDPPPAFLGLLFQWGVVLAVFILGKRLNREVHIQNVRIVTKAA